MKQDVSTKNVLYIDTASNEAAVVRLRIDHDEFERKEMYDRNKAQVILPMIEQMLHDRSLTIHDIDAIEVNPGPGSFTGLRVGVAIANTLANTLQIPINNQPPGTLVEPIYS